MNKRNQNPVVVFSNNVFEIFPGETTILVTDAHGHGGVRLIKVSGSTLEEALAQLQKERALLAAANPAHPAS